MTVSNEGRPMTTVQALSRGLLYEHDETAWLETMAELIRLGRLDEIDYPNLAEYLADMARRDRRETTVPSFYHEVRTAPDIVARREWTRQWWDNATERYELVTSLAVLDELAGGLPERGAKRLALVRDLPILPVEPVIAEIVQACILRKVMPADPAGDALHLALAS
ncbi:MAG: DUF29 family protein [Gammaproteobacteria bacterium]